MAKNGVFVEFEGFDELIKTLDGMDLKDRRAALRRIVRNGGSAMRSALRRAAPIGSKQQRRYYRKSGAPKAGKGSGNIREVTAPTNLMRSVDVFSPKGKRTPPDIIFNLVGPRMGRNAKHYDGWYAHFTEFEYGTPYGSNEHVGWFRNTVRRAAPPAKMKMIDKIADQIERQWKKIKKAA